MRGLTTLRLRVRSGRHGRRGWSRLPDECSPNAHQMLPSWAQLGLAGPEASLKEASKLEARASSSPLAVHPPCAQRAGV